MFKLFLTAGTTGFYIIFTKHTFYQARNNNTRHYHVQARNSVKNLRNLPISNPKPDLHINAHTKFGKNPMIFAQDIVRKPKYGRMDDRRTDRMTDTPMTNVKSYHPATIMYKDIDVQIQRRKSPF